VPQVFDSGNVVLSGDGARSALYVVPGMGVKFLVAFVKKSEDVRTPRFVGQSKRSYDLSVGEVLDAQRGARADEDLEIFH